MADEYRQSSALATARWADPAYISDKYYFEPGSIWLGRNPHNFDQAVGVKPEEHIFMCASTGSGKGRSIIINNIALWPGSLVVYDPKGDLPAVCAPARGEGDQWTTPMGQKVIVLDPLGHSKSDPKYLGYYDPVASLDRDDPGFREMCASLAEALVKIPEDSNHGEWAKMGREFVATIIEHVVATPDYDDQLQERNLFTVLSLIKKGRKDQFTAYCDKLVEQGKLDPKDYNARLDGLGDPYLFLFEEIAKNPHNAHLRDEAEKLRETYKLTPKTFISIRDEAARGLDWITKHAGMETALIGTLNGKPVLPSSQQFDPRDLKRDANGVSLFIVLPSDRMETFGAWVQALFVGIFAAMRRTPLNHNVRHPTLGIIDEFSSLGKQEYIANALDTIRDEGMRLLISVQQFGWMQDVYGKRAESFLENCSVKLFFGNPGETASDYLVKALGEAEVIKYAITRSRSNASTLGTSSSLAQSTSDALAHGEQTTETFGTTTTDSTSHARSLGASHSESRNQSLSHSNNWNWNNSTNWSDGRNWGQGNGRTMGRNYGPHVFWEGLEHSNSYGTSLNKSSGGSHTKGGAKSRGGGGSKMHQTGIGSSDTTSQTETETHGTSFSKSESTSRGKNFTHTKTTGETHTQGISASETFTEGESTAESFHKKPLLEYHEIRKYLSRVPDEEHDHPSYPGLMLAMIGREDPVFLRRSNYDQDPFFEGLFSKHPKFPLLAYDEQPMLGYEFTPDHILSVELPEILSDHGYSIQPITRPYSAFKKGESIFELSAPSGKVVTARAIYPGRTLSATRSDGNTMRLRIWDRAGADVAKTALSLFFLPWKKVEQDKLTAEAEAEKLRKEKEEQARMYEKLRLAKEAREKEELKRAEEERKQKESEERYRMSKVATWNSFFDLQDRNGLAKPMVTRLAWVIFIVGCVIGLLSVGVGVLIGIGLTAFLTNSHHEEERDIERLKDRHIDKIGRPEDFPELENRLRSWDQKLKPGWGEVIERYIFQQGRFKG